MRRLLATHEACLAALLAALVLAAWQVDPAFVSGRVQAGLLPQIGETALLAVPMTLIVITGGIDLSVGSAMALASVLFGLGFRSGLPVEACVAVALAAGLLCGALNGWFVTRFRVHPLIVTLGTMSAFRGLAEGISAARPVSGFPETFLGIGQGWAAIGLFVALCAAGSAVLARHVLGRQIYGTGLGEAAARASGWNVDRLKASLYAFSGLMAGVAGVLFTARRNTAKADVGAGLELEVVTAVVLGGTSIFGGRGTLIGTALGLAVLHEVRQFVGWRWSNDVLNLVVVGALLIGAVTLNGVISRRPAGSVEGG